MTSFFQYPSLLNLLWMIPLLVLLMVFYWQWQKNALLRFGHISSKTALVAKWKGPMVIAIMALLAITIANPQKNGQQQQVTQKGCDVYIAIDLSNSMLAEDIRPNRLILAKIFAQKLVRELVGNRVGIIVFAGEAYLQMPLSTDYPQAIDILNQIDAGSLSAQGTVIPAAIELSQRSYEPIQQGEAVGRALIIITDGENHDQKADEAAQKARSDDGIITFAVGAGTADGGPIPMPGGSYKRDEQNEVVRTRLNEQALQKLAQSGGSAIAYNISQGDAAISGILSAIHDFPKRNLLTYAAEERASVYQWLLLPCILLMLIAIFFKKTN